MTHHCTDELRSIDIRKLARDGHIGPGRLMWDDWRRGGQLRATIHTESRADGLLVEYRTRMTDGKWHTFSRVLTIERTPCHLGGERTWWHCPRCSKRVALLYGGRELACRNCWGAAYRCQRETLEDRAARQANKLRRELGWPVGILSDIGSRPKGMHQKTYMRLLNEHARRSELALGYLGESLERLTGRVKAGLSFTLGRG